LPVVAPTGTVTVIEVSLQLLYVATAMLLLKVTVLAFWIAPKLVPVMVTCAPTDAEFGDKEVMPGTTVKGLPLLATPAALTTMFPVVAPAGTGTTMEVSPHVVTVAGVPLKVTVLLATCVAPKLVPVIVID
jgi:hypothetical protein